MIHIAVATEILNKFLTKLFRSKVEHPTPGTFIFLFERFIPAGRLRWWQLERGMGGAGGWERGDIWGKVGIWTQVVSFPWSSATKVKRTLPPYLAPLWLTDSFSEGQKKINELMADGGGGNVSDTAAFLSLFPCNHHHHFPATSAAAVSLTAGHCGWVWRTEPLYFSLRPATVRRKTSLFQMWEPQEI